MILQKILVLSQWPQHFIVFKSVFIYVLCAVILAFQQQSNTMKLEILGFLMLYSRILSSIFLLERLKSASVSQIPYSSQLTARSAPRTTVKFHYLLTCWMFSYIGIILSTRETVLKKTLLNVVVREKFNCSICSHFVLKREFISRNDR